MAGSAEFKELEKFVEKIVAGQKQPRVNLLQQIFKTALKLALESPGTLNLKITTNVMKELRYSFKMFFPDRFIQKITVFGSARSLPDAPEYRLAKEFGEKAFQRKFMIVTGGGPGVMAAANEGAGIKGGFGLNIRLPFEQSANPFIDEANRLIHYRYFFTRKLFLLKEACALALFPGGFGTFDETFEALTLIQTGKMRIIPIIFVEPKGMNYWTELLGFIESKLTKGGYISPQDKNFYKIVHSADEALDHIEHFYRCFHSMRLVDEFLVMRLKRKLSEDTMGQLHTNFKELSKDGTFRLSGPLPEEKNEPELDELGRLVFPFERRDFATLRLLIDFINDHAV